MSRRKQLPSALDMEGKALVLLQEISDRIATLNSMDGLSHSEKADLLERVFDEESDWNALNEFCSLAGN